MTTADAIVALLRESNTSYLTKAGYARTKKAIKALGLTPVDAKLIWQVTEYCPESWEPNHKEKESAL